MSAVRLLAAGLAITACSCSGSAAPQDAAVFRVEVDSESFRVSIRDDAVVTEAERRMREEDGAGIVIGSLARGDGGFNQPWSWHMVPSSVLIADFAVEVCDGLPSHVEQDLDYWIDTVGQFCPWRGKIAERER